jgi:cytochrome c oxidase cbb3-type subunit 4
LARKERMDAGCLWGVPVQREWMNMEGMTSVLRSFWTLWVFLFFVGIVLWAYWPKNKKKVESYSDIPLRPDGSGDEKQS